MPSTGTAEATFPLRRSTRSSLLRAVIVGIALGASLAFCAEAGRVCLGTNFHTVIPGRIYRCSQPSPEQLDQRIHAFNIRTVINLRGCCAHCEWYQNECRVTHAHRVNQEDVCFSAGRLPSVGELRRLIEVLDQSEYPILLHCRRGADRTGLATVAALLLHTDMPFAQARRHLGLRFGHLALGRPANLDYFFDLYQEWLTAQGLTHHRSHFRRWAQHEYCPGRCLASIELLEMPDEVPADAPVACRVRCRNISTETWHFKPGANAGVHSSLVVSGPTGRGAFVGRAGMFYADVAPGESIDLTFVIPPLVVPGSYSLMVDMVEEQHCNFFQTGSEPLLKEFRVRAAVPPGGPSDD